MLLLYTARVKYMVHSRAYIIITQCCILVVGTFHTYQYFEDLINSSYVIMYKPIIGVWTYHVISLTHLEIPLVASEFAHHITELML